MGTADGRYQLASLSWREPQPAKPWDYLQQPPEASCVAMTDGFCIEVTFGNA